MGRYCVVMVILIAFLLLSVSASFAGAQDKAAADAMGFIQQMTDKTKACAARGISEQDCVCQNKAEWQDMLVLMLLMQNDPNVDAANKTILAQGTAKVQGMLGKCK